MDYLYNGVSFSRLTIGSSRVDRKDGPVAPAAREITSGLVRQGMELASPRRAGGDGRDEGEGEMG